MQTPARESEESELGSARYPQTYMQGDNTMVSQEALIPNEVSNFHQKGMRPFPGIAPNPHNIINVGDPSDVAGSFEFLNHAESQEMTVNEIS